jgi:hypothetical protein
MDGDCRWRGFQKATSLLAGFEEGDDLSLQFGIASASPTDEGTTICRRSDFQSVQENVVGLRIPGGHDAPFVFSPSNSQCEIRARVARRNLRKLRKS